MLYELEKQIIDTTGDDSTRLCDHFDLVAGTSGGALLAAAIALGSPMADVREFLLRNVKLMLKRAPLHTIHRSLYDKSLLEQGIKEFYGPETTLGSDKLKTLLLMVLRNRTTDSPWLISNNPFATFNQTELDDCNLHIPLWQLARASAAAPAYYMPQTIHFGIEKKYEFVFVDGALTGFLNPAFKAFQYVTNGAYRLNWKATEEDLTIVSIGSGDMRFKRLGKLASDVSVFSSLMSFPNTMMHASTREQDLLCRTFGRCITGDRIDLEVGDMKTTPFALESKMFRYHRVNPGISEPGLESIGCGHIRPKDIAPINSTKHLDHLSEVGRAMAKEIKNVVLNEWGG